MERKSQGACRGKWRYSDAAEYTGRAVYEISPAGEERTWDSAPSNSAAGEITCTPANRVCRLFLNPDQDRESLRSPCFPLVILTKAEYNTDFKNQEKIKMSDNKDKVDKISFRTSDMVCSEEIILEIKDHKIESLEFIGGCPGNLLGISKLVQGMDIDTVIQKLSGISCGGKPTSCPDQLAAALRMYKEKKK